MTPSAPAYRTPAAVRQETPGPAGGECHGRLPDRLPPREDAVDQVGGDEPRFQTEVVRQFVLEELGDLSAVVTAK